MRPNVYIIAGPNGAGKTTFARKFLPNFVGSLHFINADLIAQGLSPLSPEAAASQAGRLFLAEVRRAMDRGIDFGFETTLSGLHHKRLFLSLRSEGYAVHLIFLWVQDVELSLARVRERVAKGGHKVPEDDVRRRFRRSIQNFFQQYRQLADSWQLIDNTESAGQVIASQVGNEVDIIDKLKYRLLEAIYGAP